MRGSLCWARIQGYYQIRASALLFKKPFVVESRQPLISFSFDDFPQSAIHVGGRILTYFGVTGTYYASFGLMGKEEPSGRIFVPEDLVLIREQGHELGCHTFSHCHSWDTATAVFEQSILENRRALHDVMSGGEFQTFSYPISCPRPLTKSAASKYFMCCRGGGQTFNAGTTDLNQLAAYFLEKTRHNIQAVRDVIDRNRQARGWLIFATHDISDKPTPYGCTPEFFEDVVRCAVSSGARILPVAAALKELAVSMNL